jgi:hypothetical protein
MKWSCNVLDEKDFNLSNDVCIIVIAVLLPKWPSATDGTKGTMSF